ncbi:hypothetical protein Tco_0845250 [Tanacetum coccineum]
MIISSGVDAFRIVLPPFHGYTTKKCKVDALSQALPSTNAEHYSTLDSYPLLSTNIPVSKMYLLSFILTADPTKVRVGERQRAEDEPKLLDTTVGRVIPLLPVAPARASSELKASVEKLFDERGSCSHTERGNSVSGGHGIDILQVNVTRRLLLEDAASCATK